ncbi:MAG: HAMP domain-containing sensor histidine kinase [Rhizonema sp. PD38]|nr:HAMP domain-containing sensor histidine kinase [Rhizonema sp. PD38]
MTVSFSLEKQKNNCDDLHASATETFIGLQAEQLIFDQPICFVRIVYYSPSLKALQERIECADNQPSFSQQEIAYLRSEAWLTDFPHVWTVQEFQLAQFPKLFSYICPIGYRNQKPEYIQVITHTPLEKESQHYVKNVAQTLSKYIDLCLENLQQKSKTEMLEQLLHKVGHQLRNNIALVKLYAHNLILGLQDNSWREQATIICDRVNDLDTNLTDIISCGQESNLKIIPHDLRSIVDESIKHLQPLINQKQLKVNIPNTSATLPLDKLQMKQVFDNLLSNAIHFSPNSGSITFGWQVFRDEVLIKISDQGPGISPLDMQKIFTPFYSRRSGGTGLGLTIARKIVLDHSGNLWADSLLGGAQFCLILPTRKKYS